jgi:homoserine O-succinyltransferase
MTLLQTATHKATHTSADHMLAFYKTFDEVKDRRFDGMIITGAPVETMEFEEVKYWDELCEIMEYAKTNVQSTMFICWGAQAALHYYYGLNKIGLDKKLFGVFPHTKYVMFDPILKGTDEEFFIPHSRHTTITMDELKKADDLVILAGSDEIGASICRSKDGRRIFLMGHMEYDKYTLKAEYDRDIAKGLYIEPPKNYFRDEAKTQVVQNWHSTANIIYSNWLNYYVYQVTPFDLEKLQ